LVLTAGTGTGKTTQLPFYLAYDFILQSKLSLKTNIPIICTEPRKISNFSASSRCCSEFNFTLDNEIISIIGQNQEIHNRNGKVMFINEHAFLVHLVSDPILSKEPYKIFILDEAHERSIDLDVIMGLLRNFLIKRDDVRLIITSATINAEEYVKFFNAEQIICEEKFYPIEIIYYPIELGRRYYIETLNKTKSILNEKINGNKEKKIADSPKKGEIILVFLVDIQQVRSAVFTFQQEFMGFKEKTDFSIEICGLYGALPHEEQQLIMKCPPDKNTVKVVFATNVAETSVTFENISTIIDCGLQKIQRYNTKQGITQFEYVKISKNSAIQRAGRTGRQGAGKCYRMYTFNEYQEFSQRSEPAILLQNIGILLLWLLANGIDDLSKIELIDKPSKEILEETYEKLEDLKCIKKEKDEKGNEKRVLGKLGKTASKLGLEPKLGAMVYYSTKYECTKEIIEILGILQTNMPILYSPDHSIEKNDKIYAKVINPENSKNSIPELDIKLQKNIESSSQEKLFESLLTKLDKLFAIEKYIYNPKLLILGDLIFSLFTFHQFVNIYCLIHIKNEAPPSVFCKDCRKMRYQWCLQFNVKCKTMEVAFKNCLDLMTTFSRYCTHMRNRSKIKTVLSHEIYELEEKIGKICSIYLILKSADKSRFCKSSLFEYFVNFVSDLEKTEILSKILSKIHKFYISQCYEKITPVFLKVYNKQLCLALNIKKECKRRIVNSLQLSHRSKNLLEDIQNEILKRSSKDRKFLWNCALEISYVNVDTKTSAKIHEGSVLHTLHYNEKQSKPYAHKLKKLSANGKISAIFPPRYILFTDQVSTMGRTVMNLLAIDEHFVKLYTKKEIRDKIGYLLDSFKHTYEYIYLDIGLVLLSELNSIISLDTLNSYIKPVNVIPYYQTNKLGVICSLENAPQMLFAMGEIISQAISRIQANYNYHESYWKTGICIELGLGGNIEYISADTEFRRIYIRNDQKEITRPELIKLLIKNGIKFMNAIKLHEETNSWIIYFKNKAQFDRAIEKLCPLIELTNHEEILENNEGHIIRPIKSTIQEFRELHSDFFVKLCLPEPIPQDILQEQLEKYYGKVQKITYPQDNGKGFAVFISFKENLPAHTLISEVSHGVDAFNSISAKEILRNYSVKIPYEISCRSDIMELLKIEISRINKRYGSDYVSLGNFVKIYSDNGEVIQDAVYLVQPEVFTLSRFCFNLLFTHELSIPAELAEIKNKIFDGMSFSEFCFKNHTSATMLNGASIIKIYGMPENRLNCKNFLMKFVSIVLQITRIEIIDLSHIQHKHAKTLYDFIQYHWNLVESNIDTLFKQIILKGDNKQISQIVEFISNSIKPENSTKNPLKSKLLKFEQCPICLSKKSLQSDYITLALCGHKFCKWCVNMQIGSALRNHPNADLPLKCAECGEFLLPQDWELCGALRYYYKILHAAMKHYILQSKNIDKTEEKPEFEWCENPLCKAVYSTKMLNIDQTTRICKICNKNMCRICGLDVF